MTTFLSNREIYTSVVCGIMPQARERIWIATADIKDMYVDVRGRDMVPFLGGAGRNGDVQSRRSGVVESVDREH